MNANNELLRQAAELLRQFDVKVKNVEELQEFLRQLPGIADPEVEAARSVRTVCVTTSSVTLGVTGLVTLALVLAFSNRPGIDSPLLPAALGIVWGCAALISLATLMLGFLSVLLRRRTGPTERPVPADGSTPIPEALPTARPAAPAEATRFTLL
jgi:hypothetical protein